VSDEKHFHVRMSRAVWKLDCCAVNMEWRPSGWWLDALRSQIFWQKEGGWGYKPQYRGLEAFMLKRYW